MAIIPGIMDNKILMAALTAWLVAQVLKVVVILLLQRKLEFRFIVSSGGFPSSHSAMVSALTLGIGKYYGWNSPVFAAVTVFSLIVMYDAAGVRREAGRQAEALNLLFERFSQGSDLAQERLKELIGHTPFEVFGGVLVGIAVVLFA